MSYITPAQFRNGMQGAKDYVDEQISAVAVSGGGIVTTYIVGEKPYDVTWLSLTSDGEALSPINGSVYCINTVGDYNGLLFMWDASANKYRQIGDKLNFSQKDSIVRTLDARNVGSSDPVRILGFVPSEDTATIHVEISVSIGSYGGRVRYGFEDSLRSVSSSTTVSVDIPVTEADKEKNFIVDVGMTGAFVSSTVNSGTVTEVMKVEYVTDFVHGKSGLVPSVPTGTNIEVLTPHGWDEVDFNITKDEIKTAFDEAYGDQRPSNNVYSLEEQVIGTWIDGKPLYRKTIELDNTCFVANSGKSVAHGISNLDNVISKYGFCYRRVNGIKTRQTIPQSYFGSLSWNLDIQDINDTNMIIQVGSGWGNQIEYGAVTFEYTKTTDPTS